MRPSAHSHLLQHRGGSLRTALWSLTLASSLLWLAGGCARQADPEVRLLAASSLAELAHRLATGYAERSGESVSLQLASSATLARQLLQGAPGDLFLSADGRWIEGLPWIEHSEWLGNGLVWVVPVDSSAISPEQADSLALGAEGVPLGRYAEEALASRGMILPPRLVRGMDARATLAIVSSGAVDGGVVYATDAALDPGVRVIETLSPAAGHPVRYAAALLHESGRGIYQALRAPWMVSAARELGFTVVP